MTATATAKVRNDIKSLLCLRNPFEVVTSFDRPNLQFFVHEKTESLWNDLCQWVTNLSGSVIIYVLSRKGSEDIGKMLRSHGVNCAWYHAGITNSALKNGIVKRFMNGEVKVMVSTIAFGMGIDRQDIRTVVHYGCSKNLESYYQEVGRAGRDGLPSKVVTYFTPDDFDLQDSFLDRDEENGRLSIFVKKTLLDLSMHIRKFVHSPMCRRLVNSMQSNLELTFFQILTN